MTTPNQNPDIHINHPKALQYEISWLEYATTLKDIESEVKSLTVPNSLLPALAGSAVLEVPFAEIAVPFLHSAVTAYNEACHEFQSWCGQGNSEMNNIAKALRESFRLYSRTEEEIVQSFLTVFEALD